MALENEEGPLVLRRHALRFAAKRLVGPQGVEHDALLAAANVEAKLHHLVGADVDVGAAVVVVAAVVIGVVPFAVVVAGVVFIADKLLGRACDAVAELTRAGLLHVAEPSSGQ